MLLLDGCPNRSSSRLHTLTLLILIYNNDLPDNLTSNPKLLSDVTSWFSRITDPNATANQNNTDLHNNNTWVYQWKVGFIPQEVIFSRKTNITTQPQLVFEDNPIHQNSIA